MLSRLPKTLLILFVGFTFLAGVMFYAFTNYRQDAIVVTANETIRSAVISSRDYSARVNQGQFKLQIELFESEFIRLFNENRNLESEAKEDIQFTFDYLEDGEGGILAIRVEIGLNDQVFQTTVILNSTSR